MTQLITIALSLVILAGFHYLHKQALAKAVHDAQQEGFKRGYEQGRSERKQGDYAQGYMEGKAEGRALEARENETSAQKHFNRGYQAAFEEMQNQSEQQNSTCIAA